MKRAFLFIVTNLAVMLVLSAVWTFVAPYVGYGDLSGDKFPLAYVLTFAAIFGFGGAFISLLMSKFIAKMSVGAVTLDSSNPGSEQAAWLVSTVEKLARRAEIKMPEVAIYSGAPNAFATGASKNNSLVAVSDGLLRSMNRSEIEAVLGHEIAHVANGDMVTLTLVQGVMNTFVIFLSRLVGFFVDRALGGERRGRGPGYFLTFMLCQILFGLLAGMVVAWVSRRREFRADAGSAEYLYSAAPMISALRRLGGLEDRSLPDSLQAFGIAGGRGASLFASHPPIEERINALSQAGN